MSNTKDKNVIDEKKAEKSGTSTDNPDLKVFLTKYVISIFTICVVVFCIGGAGLYTCKVVQANIIPDDIDLFPYSNIPRDVNSGNINIDIMRPSLFFNKGTICRHAVFDAKSYSKNFTDTFVCKNKNWGDSANKDSSVYGLFFSQVYNNLLQKNYAVINTVFTYFNCFPETVMMVLYGFFGMFFWIGMLFFNMGISIWYHLAKSYLLFKIPSKDKKQWVDNPEGGGLIYSVKSNVFYMCFMPLLFMSYILSIPFFTFYTMLSPLSAKYKISSYKNDNDKNRTYSFIDYIKNNFVYKKQFFFILSTISLLKNGQQYLGNNAVAGIILAVLFAYYMGLYNNTTPEIGTDGFIGKLASCKQLTVKINDEVCDGNIEIIDGPETEGGSTAAVTKPAVVTNDAAEGANVVTDDAAKPAAVTDDAANAAGAAGAEANVVTDDAAEGANTEANVVTDAKPAAKQKGGKKHTKGKTLKVKSKVKSKIKVKRYNFRLV